MNPKDLTILIRDTNDVLVAELDEYSSFSAKVRFNNAGNFQLITDLNNRHKSKLLTPGYGIVVRRGDQTIMSGPIWYFKKEWSENDYTEKLTLTGPDDTGLLETRVIIPEPATAAPPYSTDSHHVETGLASTVIYNYINEHLGPGARTGRPFPGITMASDPLTGSTITGRGRYHNLLSYIQELAISGGDLGFEIIDKEVLIYAPTDKTGSIVLSTDIGNIKKYRYSFRYPEANYIFVGGQNELTARTIVEREDTTSTAAYEMYEAFKDQRNLSVTAELQAAGDAELAERTEEYTLVIEPSEESGILYQQDYKLGDKIRARIDGENLDQIIREVRILSNRTEASILPVLGTVGSTENPLINNLLFRDREKFENRITNMEQR